MNDLIQYTVLINTILSYYLYPFIYYASSSSDISCSLLYPLLLMMKNFFSFLRVLLYTVYCHRYYIYFLLKKPRRNFISLTKLFIYILLVNESYKIFNTVRIQLY